MTDLGQCAKCSRPARVVINRVAYCAHHTVNPDAAPEPIEPLLLRIPEVAKLLNLPRSSAYDLVASGQIPGVVRLGRRVMVRRDEFERFIRRDGKSDG